MRRVQVLKFLPVLNQDDFPPLPAISKGTTLAVFDSAWQTPSQGSEWQNHNKEMVGAILTAACAHKGAWQPIVVKEFIKHINAHPAITFEGDDVMAAMWKLADSGELDFIQVGKKQYIVPTPGLANKVLEAKRKANYKLWKKN